MLILLLTLSPIPFPPAQAAGTPTVFVAPASHALVAHNAVVNFWINVSSMPNFNGFNMLVKVNAAQLTITSISTNHIIFATPSEDINCVNAGTGIAVGQPGNIGCVTGLDGPGIAHEEVFCLGCFASGNGLLFNVTFTEGITGATGSVIDIYNDVIDTPPITAPHITVDGTYGTPVGGDFTIAASPFSQAIPEGRAGSATITLHSLTTFASTVNLNAASVAAGLPVAFNTTSVALTAGATKFVAATISPTSLNPGGAYNLIVNASGGSPNLIHAINLNITVTVPDFSIVASPTSLVNPLGSSNSTTLTLMSINTFTGKVTISFTVSPIVANSPSITLTNSSHTGSSVTVDLSSGVPTLIEGVAAGGTSSVTLNVTVTCVASGINKCTAVNTYNVKVTGTIGTASRAVNVAATVTSAVAGPDFAISATTPVNFDTGATGAAATVTVTATGGAPGAVTRAPASPARLPPPGPARVQLPP